MRARDLHHQSELELREQLERVRSDLFKARIQTGSNQLKNPHQITMLRKDVARILTILHQKANQTS